MVGYFTVSTITSAKKSISSFNLTPDAVGLAMVKEGSARAGRRYILYGEHAPKKLFLAFK